MASPTIDVLLQATTTPRAGDGAGRSGDSGSAFKPALEQALAEQPRTDAADSENASAAPAPPATDEQAAAHDAPQDADDQTEVAATDEAPEEDAAADEDDVTDAADSVEISEAAAAAKQAASQTASGKAAVRAAELKTTAANDGDADQATTDAEALTDAKNGAGGANASTDAAKSELATAAGVEVGQAHLAHGAQEESSRCGDAKKSAAADKAGTKASSEKNSAAQAPGQLGGDEEETDAKPPAEAQAIAATKPRDIRAESTEGGSDKESSAPEVKKQAAGSRASAAQAAIAAASAEATVATAPVNEESTDDGSVQPPTVNSAAAQASPRGAASLERLSAPRGVHPGGSTNETESGPPVDRTRFVSRVEGAMRAAHQRDGRVQVRLSPPELGSLRIELTMHNGALTAHVEAETAGARKLLLDNLPALRERLAQQDIRVEKFDVDVRRDGGGSAGGNGPQDRPAEQPWRQPQDTRPRGAAAAPAAIASRSPKPVAPAITDSGLDVRV